MLGSSRVASQEGLSSMSYDEYVDLSGQLQALEALSLEKNPVSNG
jgi:hypothetical protein